MDDVSCCLSQVINLCIEANIFINQLYKFEDQLYKLYSSYNNIPSEQFFSIFNRFSVTINDLNLYHKNDFLKFYSNVFTYLSRKSFTINYSNEPIENDFNANLLNNFHFFLHHQKKSSKKEIFYYLHKLSITCSLCLQYRQLCTHVELADRFVYLRMDLLTNLNELNNQIDSLLIRINQNFEQRKKSSREYNQISNLLRSVFLWVMIMLFIGCYLLWPIVYESKPKPGWPM